MVWVWPYAALWNSVREIGFRGATLCCGLVLVLCALRVHRHRAGPATHVILGLAAGIGWWASPEIGYFVIPAVVLLVAGWNRLYAPPVRGAAPLVRSMARRPLCPDRTGRHRRCPPLALLEPEVELRLVASRQSCAPAVRLWTRVSIFFHDVLPSQLGVRTTPGGAWVGGSGVGHTLFVVILVVLAVMLLRVAWMARLGRVAAPLLAAGLAVVAFPFLYAYFPTSWYWADGRYGVYLPPLLVLLAVWSLPGVIAAPSPTATRARPRRHRGHAVVAVTLASLGLAAGICSTVVLAHDSAGVPTHPRAFFSGWSDPNEAARQVVRSMAAHHIRTAYGDYWTAYDLDFLAPHTVTVSPSPLDVQRSAGLARSVRDGTPQAWLFFAPGHEAVAGAAFSNPEPGPGGYSESAFIAYLTAHGDAYKVVRLGILDAVIPKHPVGRLPPLG